MLVVVQQEYSCDLCTDTGMMTWQQPVPGPDGALALSEMSHPCVNGCSGWFRLPAAESATIIDSAMPVERMTGNVADANKDHRTEWFRPAVPPSEYPLRLE